MYKIPKPVKNLETTILRLLLIRQQWKIELGPVFAYMVCVFAQALNKGQGFIRESYKSGLVKRLGIVDILW